MANVIVSIQKKEYEMRCVWLTLVMCLSTVQGTGWDDCRGVGVTKASSDSLLSGTGSPVRVASHAYTHIDVDAPEASATGAPTEVISEAREDVKSRNQISLCLSLGGLRFDQDAEKELKAVADRVKAGDTVQFIFDPPVQLRDAAGSIVSIDGTQHYFDTIPWTAWLRAGVKWWLNPLAWWNPAQYSVCRDQCKVTMLDGVVVIQAEGQKTDLKYVGSQLMQYLFQTEWTTTWFYPNVNGYTAYMAQFALKRRFRAVEKPVLEAAGFKDVELVRGIYSETQQLRWMIRATKT